MTTPYVYKLTHIPTMKWYVGSRYAKGCHPDDNYMSSSRTVRADCIINPLNWIKTIIAIGNAQEMYELESDILQLTDAKNDLRSFNLHNNDGLGSVYKGPWNKGLKLTGLQAGWTNERREAARQRLIGKPSRALGTKWTNKAKEKQSTNKIGKKLSIEHCTAISNARLGGPGHFKGKNHSAETIQKMISTKKLIKGV